MIDKHLIGIEKPGRYVGLEINAYRKSFEEASVRFALAFPDVYEIGMSHLGLKLLYHQLNRAEGVMADRVYSPWPDYENKLRELGEPLRAIESERPLADFDFLGFSLQYELSYSNILTILDLAAIPLHSRERTLDHPLVVGGGPCAFNPEPLADFFDFFVLGEAEEVLPEIITAYREWKASGGRSREDFLFELRKIPGIYVPAFFDVSYNPDGTIRAIIPRFSDYTGVRKRLVHDLDAVCPIPDRPLVPLIDIVHNRLGLEIARGCTRGCRFCQASFIYRPVRERHPDSVLGAAKKALAASGFEDVSLLSFSTGDYCGIQYLLSALVKELGPRRIAISFPSMRVGTLTPELMEHIKKIRKTGFTLAPEAGSERLRRVINKGIRDDDLLSAAETAFSLGWRVLKLYFMMGLPGETDADREELVELCLKVWEKAKKTRAAVNVSISTFVPKPLTPFQWSSQLSEEQIGDYLRTFRERLRKPGLKMKWNAPACSIFEAVFARGDRRLGGAIKRAWELGARFDGWTDYFKEDIWNRALAETGLNAAFYAQRGRSQHEILPWDHISAGVSREYLWQEYEKAAAEEFTPDCRKGGCTACGVCDHQTVSPLIHEHAVPQPELGEPAARGDHSSSSGDDKEYVYRVIYSKLGKARFFGQLEVAAAFERAIRRAGLPAAFSKGHHPHPKISFGEALPLGMETIIAEAYITLTEDVNPAQVRDRLNAQFNDVARVSIVSRVDKRPAAGQPCRAVYMVSGLSPFLVGRMIAGAAHCGEAVLTKKTKKGEARALLRDLLLDIRKTGENSLEMDIAEAPLLCFRPLAILQHLAGEHAPELDGSLVCKIASYRLDLLEGSEDACRAHNK
ncbi:MAG: TIGR03960 family B12-binding radical SAM protein [Syntrophobacteraceae bacterium]